MSTAPCTPKFLYNIHYCECRLQKIALFQLKQCNVRKNPFDWKIALKMRWIKGKSCKGLEDLRPPSFQSAITLGNMVIVLDTLITIFLT
mmetsp:Transcript_22585/g.40548  ORF Transcript_22585/g.40548 Transcript_22585/m.40548 type:complete len:89 (-) Transcript_22585:4179-4445(-)